MNQKLPEPSVIVTMLGARQHYAVPRLLHREGLLAALITDFYASNVGLRALMRVSARMPVLGEAFAGASGRYHPDLVNARVVANQSLGLGLFLRRQRARKRSELQYIKYRAASDLADRYAELSPVQGEAVIAYAGAALEVFEVAQKRGALRVLDQSIAAYPHIHRLLAIEVAAHGAMVIEKGKPALEGGEIKRLREEWKCADLILCASEFVFSSMVDCGVPASKCHLVPYGVSLPKRQPRLPDYAGQRPLRLLFAGHVGLRKGVPHLLKALSMLDSEKVELRCAGTLELRPEIAEATPANIQFLGRVPRAQMEDLYNWADVFVLPSIIEGSALVVYEALSFGLPVITTFNAGSVVEDGVEGMIVPASDSFSIAASINAYLDDPLLLETHAAAARSAGPKIELPRYERDLLSILRQNPGTPFDKRSGTTA